MPPFLHKGRVAFHETDAAGIVHFSNYFRYAEEAETAALASLGIFSEESLRHYSFPRVQASAQYNKPLRFPDVYTVSAVIKRIGRSSLTWCFDISTPGRTCAAVEVTSVRCSTEDGCPCPYFPHEIELLRTLMPHTEKGEESPQK